eukprot:6868875-Pyramimonas_sp.AAC.2
MDSESDSEKSDLAFDTVSFAVSAASVALLLFTSNNEHKVHDNLLQAGEEFRGLRRFRIRVSAT